MVNVPDFISDSNLFKKFKVDDLLFVEYRCYVEDVRTDIWSHNNLFAYALTGKKTYKTLQHEYTLHAGESFFLKKGANTIYQHFDDSFCAILIFMPDDFIRAVIKKHALKFAIEKKSIPTDAVVPLRLNPVLAAYFQSIMPYFNQSAPPSDALLKAKLEEILLILFSSDQNMPLINYFHDLCTNSALCIKEVMEENFHKNFSLDQFARICARSLSAFKRDFFSVYGIAPGKWLMEKRLEYSRYLLESTFKTIDEIITESGFTNMSHFIKIFKNKFGVTPYQFRKAEHSV